MVPTSPTRKPYIISGKPWSTPASFALLCSTPWMKFAAAYLLAVLGGNTIPSCDDLKDILEAVGAEADDDRIEFLLSEVKGKDITELIASGREKFASVPSGGAVAVAGSSACWWCRLGPCSS